MWWRRRAKEPARPGACTRFREATSDRADEFVARGFAHRHFFPHRAYYLHLCGADGAYLSNSIYGISDPTRLRQVALFAIGDALEGIPPSLFFDDDIVWHRQQLGMPGHVAAANLVLDGKRLLTTARYSDVVQRIGRRRELATRIEKRFRGWDQLLLNAVLGYAIENGFEEIHLPTAETALANVDKKRSPKLAMFQRIYDHDVTRRFDAVRLKDRWIVEVKANRGRWVALADRKENLPSEPTVVVCHDTERELGHLNVDLELVALARERAADNLREMLDVEAAHAIRATYDVVGCFMNDVRPDIEARGHEVAFHSYDHGSDRNQLGRCREVDYRIKGYRAPQSNLTSELSDPELARFNFEWLASSHHSLGSDVPTMRGGIARLPILFDDFPLYSTGVAYDAWERELLTTIAGHQYAAFGLHDCYAHLWLPQLGSLLRRLGERARFTTMGEVAAQIALGCAE